MQTTEDMKYFVLIFFFLASRAALSQDVNKLLLQDYRPVSIHNTPKTIVNKARFPVIDMHSHAYATSLADIERWITNMDQFGIEKTVLLTYATGAKFDSLYSIYSKYDDRFELWCGFDYTGYKEEGWAQQAVNELVRCYEVGAKGVGELGDKGMGLFYAHPTPAYGMHIDDARIRPLIKKCGELGMPINIHVAEPYWMYEKMDSTNDGLINANKWRIDLTSEGILSHGDLVTTLENVVRDNPGTTFIACHLANCSYDLSILGEMFDKYPNLYADISARFAELAPVPRYSRAFIEKYQDRLLYGTDMGFSQSMYAVTFRLLQTADEHFYEIDLFNYHWPLYGFDLEDSVLRKLYYENAVRILD